MTPDQTDALLRETFDDLRLTRRERHNLRDVFSDAHLTHDTLAQIRAQAFQIARAETQGDNRLMALGWLEDVVKALHVAERLNDNDTASRPLSEAHFSPGDGPRLRIARLFDHAKAHVDVCVFTVTDNRITEAIEAAHRRGVRVRIITDNDKSTDRGSDIDALAKRGIPVRRDLTDAHMHHKFAVFDRKTLLTGSYNWTRSAASRNQENVIVVDDQRLVRKFAEEFERLWVKFQ